MRINTSVKRFKASASKVEDIVDAIDEMGEGIIQVKSMSSIKSSVYLDGFDVAKPKFDFNGVREYTLARGEMQLFPESSGVGIGFVMDTPANRKKICEYMTVRKCEPLSAKERAELIDWATERGIKTKSIQRGRQFVYNNKREERLTKSVDDKDFQISQLKLEMDNLKKQMEIDKMSLDRNDFTLATNKTALVKNIDEEGVEYMEEIDVTHTAKGKDLNDKPSPAKKGKPAKKAPVRKK